MTDATDATSLRETTPADLPTLFRFQADEASNRMAGTKAYSEAAFYGRWEEIFKDPRVIARMLLEHGQVVGSISCFVVDGADHIGYWIAREHWGRGLATRAVALMLREVERRPLHATAASDNAASVRVLQRAGFRCVAREMGVETERYVAREVVRFVLE